MRLIDTFPTNKIKNLEYRIGRVFPFGATIVDDGVNFSVFSKEAKGCTLVLSRHGQVEYLTTMKYIRESLEGLEDPAVLEVGAGTGRYSVTLAKAGVRVTAVELVEHNLALLRQKLDGTEPITALQGSALDLSAPFTEIDIHRVREPRPKPERLLRAAGRRGKRGASHFEALRNMWLNSGA